MEVLRRGHYKVFLGMAPGSGKTYRMLAEAYAARQAGRDVAIGLIETHGRPDTESFAEGFELIPRRSVEHRGVTLMEMDLPEVLRRAPELCLVDELAHTNATGLEHKKRYEDIEDILNAGIDVFSTVNVQHLESLNDSIAELSGVRVRETFPDEVLQKADEVVLVDITPEALLDRLRAGNIYPHDRIAAALNNFFKIENLTALREVALRQLAENVDIKRLSGHVVRQRDENVSSESAQAVGEHLLALIEPQPNAQRLIRRAWRSSQRLAAPLDLLWVRPPHGKMSDEQEHALTNLRELAGVLGVKLIVEEADDPAAKIAEVARELGTTYILMNKPQPLRGLARLKTPLALRLAESLPGVDVRLVSSRSQKPKEEQA